MGTNYPCFIIAEAGVNHNGSVELAKKLIDAAVDAKADAIKFQTFKAEELATEHVEKADYQKSSTEKNESQLEMLKKLELSEEEFKELYDYCQKKGIIFLSTPFDYQSADLLERLGILTYKISSGDLNNYPFLSYVAKKGKPIILSTGMSTIDEISRAIQSIHNTGKNDVILLQCTSSYPAPFDEINLRVMDTLRKKFSIPVGFSDHTVGIEVPLAAVALGASVIEKHFTLDRSMDGPDHKASIEPKELKLLIRSVRNVEAALGSSDKKPMLSEKDLRIIARKKIVAVKDIKKGEILSFESLSFKRSSIGLDPSSANSLIGKKSKRVIKKDAPILLEYVEV
ncbi:N-acetylneuraminate synthase [Candidatus Micrarchaeota archaeon]|nr:N-acetylneuraminate synthase [Candidatus Micrarchaeota archaeon]